MKNFFIAIKLFFQKLFSADTARAITAGIEQAAPYVQAALEMCRLVEGFMPAGGKTIGTVVRYADSLGIAYLFKGEVTDQTVGTALRDITVKALQAKFPEASTSTLNRAVELAVGAMKNS